MNVSCARCRYLDAGGRSEGRCVVPHSDMSTDRCGSSAPVHARYSHGCSHEVVHTRHWRSDQHVRAAIRSDSGGPSPPRSDTAVRRRAQRSTHVGGAGFGANAFEPTPDLRRCAQGSNHRFEPFGREPLRSLDRRCRLRGRIANRYYQRYSHPRRSRRRSV